MPTADRFAERHREARAGVVDGVGLELAVVDEVGHVSEPVADAVRVDRRQAQIAELREEPPPPVGRVVLERASGHVGPVVGEQLVPEGAKRVPVDDHLSRGGPPRRQRCGRSSLHGGSRSLVAS